MPFYTTIEFYVIISIVAAMIIALMGRPQSRGAVTEHLVASTLFPASGAVNSYTDPVGAPYTSPIPADTGGADSQSAQPCIVFECLDNGMVKLTRYGLEDITVSGACSLAITTDGVNVHIAERLVAGHHDPTPADHAVFMLDFLRQGYYHIKYDSDATGLFAAFQLHVRPGIVAKRELYR